MFGEMFFILICILMRARKRVLDFAVNIFRFPIVNLLVPSHKITQRVLYESGKTIIRAKYRDLSVVRRSITVCVCLRHRAVRNLQIMTLCAPLSDIR